MVLLTFIDEKDVNNVRKIDVLESTTPSDMIETILYKFYPENTQQYQIKTVDVKRILTNDWVTIVKTHLSLSSIATVLGYQSSSLLPAGQEIQLKVLFKELGRIKLNSDLIPSTVQGKTRDCTIRAIRIAERYLNLDSAKQAFAEYGVTYEDMVAKAIQVCYLFEASPPGTDHPLAWCFKDDPTAIYLNSIFETRLYRLNVSISAAAAKEVKFIVFAMAISIVHEFGHLAMQSPPQNPAINNVSGSPPPSSTISAAIVAQVHSTPEQYKEAGRYIERKLFFEKALALICKKTRQSLTWSPDREVVGVALDSCTHDRYLCESCQVNGLNKEHCRAERHIIPDCRQCAIDSRYKFIQVGYILRVHDFYDTITDEVLARKSLIETNKSLRQNHVAYSLKYSGAAANFSDSDTSPSEFSYLSKCGVVSSRPK